MPIRKEQKIILLSVFFSLSLMGKWSFSDVRDWFSINLPENIFKEVNKAIPGKLQAKNIRFILPNSVEMDDIEVLDENNELVLAGKHAKVVISIASLLTNNIIIKDAIVTEPYFRYTVINGVHNVIEAFSSKENNDSSSEKIRVTIEKVRAINGTFEMYHDVGLDIFAHGIEANGSFWVEPGPFSVDINRADIKEGGIYIAGMDLPLTNLVTEHLKISDESVSTPYLTAKYEKADLRGEGEVDIKNDVYRVKAGLDAPKNTWPSGLVKMPFSIPSFRANVTLSGKLTDPQIWTTVNHDDFILERIPIKNGEINALVNSDSLYVDSSKIHLAKQGLVVAQGRYNFGDHRYDFDGGLSNVLVDHLTSFLDVHEHAQGSINAEIAIIGHHQTTRDQVEITTKGKIKNGVFDRLTLHSSSDFDAAFSYVVDQEFHLKKLTISDEKGSVLKAAGMLSLPLFVGDISTELALSSVKEYVGLDNNKLVDAKKAHVKGVVSFTRDKPEFQGHFAADLLKLDKLNIEHPDAIIDLRSDLLQIDVSKADAYSGNLSAQLTVAHPYDGQKLQGQIMGEGLDIGALPTPFRRHVMGKVDANITLSGTLTNPDFIFSLTTEKWNFYHLAMQKSFMHGSFKDDLLLIDQLNITANPALITGNNLSLNLASESLQGMVSVSDLSWPWLLNGVSDQVSGEMEGSISLDGSLKDPLIEGLFEGRSMMIGGVSLGKGLIGINLKKRDLQNSSEKNVLVASISANLNLDGAKTVLRSAYSLKTNTFNFKGKLSSVLVDSDKTFLKNSHTRFHGLVDGEIRAHGQPNNPAITLKLRAPRYVLNRDFHEKNPFPDHSNYMGPLTINASLQDHHMRSDVCAMINDSVDDECHAEGGIQLSANGSFYLDHFNLALVSGFNIKNVEQAVNDLREEFIGLSIAGAFAGSLEKKSPKSVVKLSGKLSLKEMEVNLPNIKNITLKEPAVITLEGNNINLGPRLLFDFAEGNLAVNGTIKNDQVDIAAKGNIPLMVSRFFVPLVQRAKGVLTGEIRATGKITEPILEGKITIEKGSALTFKKWFDPVEFNHGVIHFIKTGPRSFSTNLSEIDAKVGEGHLFIDGQFFKTYERLLATKIAQNFSFKVVGNGITFRDKNAFVEADVDMYTEQQKNKTPTLKGQVVLTDGQYYQQFDLRNFIAKAEHSFSGTDWLSKSQIPLNLDVELLVRQFGVSARMVNVDISSTFSGQLKTVGTVNNPKMIGSLTLNEGTVNFPFNQFDLFETSIPMNETSNRFFDPEINIQSTKELTKEEYPVLSQDTVVQLSLIGDRENLRLGLAPISGDLKLSPFKIFLLLLSPGMAQANDFDQISSLKSGAKNAFLAFSGEIFLRPLANEFAEMLQGNTQTKVKLGSTLEPGSVRLNLTWTLSPRIELIGSYSFLSDNRLGLEYEQKSNLNYNRYLLGEIKSKITLFDHPPAGPLFLETSFGANRLGDDYEPRGSILFRYRVYEK